MIYFKPEARTTVKRAYDSVKNAAFALETVAHLQRHEGALLPLVERLRFVEEDLRAKLGLERDAE